MNINKHIVQNAGTDYFNLTDDADATLAFGFNVKTWAGEAVKRVDVRARTAGNPRKLEVVTASGRTFVVTCAPAGGVSLIPPRALRLRRGKPPIALMRSGASSYACHAAWACGCPTSR